MIVMKFGGTSVQDVAAIKRAADIVHGRLAQKPVVIVSAMAKVTDQLLRCAAAASQGDRTGALAESIAPNSPPRVGTWAPIRTWLLVARHVDRDRLPLLDGARGRPPLMVRGSQVGRASHSGIRLLVLGFRKPSG